MGILLKEHVVSTLKITKDITLFGSDTKNHLLHLSDEKLNIKPRIFKTERGIKYPCFQCAITETEVKLTSDYFVGIDWLTHDRYIHIEPKLNTAVTEFFESITEDETEGGTDEEAEQKISKENVTDSKEIDIIGMLMQIMSHADVAKYTDKLLVIDWDAPEIPITQKQDLLTPFLIVRFLNILQDITRKGLKKSYYKVQENLRNRVKGKILVGQQIKQNIFKNQFANTVCEYQVFGEDSVENRFLKKVFAFCANYVENHSHYFKGENNISWLINYIRPAFEHINSDFDIQDIKNYKYNPFFQEYKEALKIGQQILKRFAYTMTKTVEEKYATPPFWIDMPKMFELYVFTKLLKDNSQLTAKHLNYQFATHGNSLDFLICFNEQKIVVDTKYKMKYNYSQVHEDIRQVAGYARLRKVKEEKPKLDSELPCLIIYPNPVDKQETENNETLKLENLCSNNIKAYHEVYKIGVRLPVIT